MRSNYIRRCKACKVIIFHGYTFTEDEHNDIYGDYDEGAGECKVCGKELCNDCGEIKGGVCKTCRERMEEAENGN